MPRIKSDKVNLKDKYPLYVEIGLVLSLAVLVVAFRLDLTPDRDTDWEAPEQEQIEMEEIQQTQQQETPPPPPKPPVPVEVPNDETLEDEALNLDASLDLDAPAESAPPPPPPEEEEEEEEEPEIFVVVEQMPELIGGLQSIQQHITYPEMAKKAGVEGRVIVQFVVNEEGNVVDPQVVRGLGAGLDDVAVNAVRQAKFEPGMQRGQPVKVKMSLPVTFRLR
ncbi:MAG: energy transducer TonB [Rhodothermales bacterium]